MIRQNCVFTIERVAGNITSQHVSRLHAPLVRMTLSDLLAGMPKSRMTVARSSSSTPKDQAQAAIEKAEALHVELKEMIAARRAGHIKQSQKPFGSSFVSFLKQSKPEIINIFFAFVCVLLAYQTHGMRLSVRKLLATQEERDSEISRLRGILATLSDAENEGVSREENDDLQQNIDSFSARLSCRCAGVVKNMFAESEHRVGYSWILGKRLASGDAMEIEQLADNLQPIILSEIQSVVGDAAFTAEELKEIRVAALKKNQTSDDNDLLSEPSGDISSKQSAQMSGLMEMLDEIHTHNHSDKGIQDNESLPGDTVTTSKMKRTRYAI